MIRNHLLVYYCRDSVVSIVTILLAGRYWVWFPARERGLSLLENNQRISGAHPASHSVGTPAYSGRRVELTTYPSNAKVKNEWIYTSVPILCLLGLHRGKSTFVCFYVVWIRSCNMTSWNDTVLLNDSLNVDVLPKTYTIEISFNMILSSKPRFSNVVF